MKILALLCGLLVAVFHPATAQIPVEIFAGHESASLDLMFFRYFENRQEKPSPFLFFSRNRATIDYQMTTTEALPAFAFTEAVSYNPKQLKGFAPVLVGQVFNSGVFPKAGIQFVHLNPRWTVFTWSVMELARNPRMDCYLLLRYTPALSPRWGLFSQLETLNTFPTREGSAFSFWQTARLGLDCQDWQWGLAGNFSQRGNQTYTTSANFGLFLRHEF